MDDILFSNSFYFTVFRHTHTHHTNRENGVLSHHIGKLIRGTACIKTVQGQRLDLKSGDIFYMPMGMQYNSYWYPTDPESKTVEYESYRFDILPFCSGQRYALQKFEPNETALGYLERLSQNKTVSCLSVGLLLAFLGEVLPSLKQENTSSEQALFTKAKAYISGQTHFRVPCLAKHLAMSESAVYAFFRNYANTTPTEVKNQLLADKAVTLLCETDFSVEKICTLVGLRSTAHLRKTIKKHTGKTPSEIRRERRLSYII